MYSRTLAPVHMTRGPELREPGSEFLDRIKLCQTFLS
uniref:Uncharacterized protein n=1 Tax=Setaria viridis TaxID=4556 RepID=A0A4U6SXF1_SETVI|nr:hypothetical protein SEVIR_9G185050v2 [Setaria viridis]